MERNRDRGSKEEQKKKNTTHKIISCTKRQIKYETQKLNMIREIRSWNINAAHVKL